jgi:hypothetical protein
MKLERVLAVLALGAMLTPAARSQQSRTIHDISWLEGCWMASSGPRTVEENWTVPRGGTMIGVSRAVRDGRLTGYELIILKEDGGTLVYEAHPSGQAPNEFRATVITATSAVFEDPDHDFPQRVCYRLVGPDSLLAWVEGTINGQEKRIEFPYTRVACPGRPAN